MPVLDPRLHSQFVEHMGRCVNGGIWDGGAVRPEVRDALARLAPPVLRWPGGCYADDYRWTDGVGPREARPTRVTNHWGVNEFDDHSFGTHEFVALCREIGAGPWFGANMGSGSPREFADWVEYCNLATGTTLADLRRSHGAAEPYEVRYWGIGNESWDCGGKFDAASYAREYRRFESHLPQLRGTAPLYLVGVGPDGNNLAENDVWTTDLFAELARRRRPRMHGYDVHFYLWATDRACGTVTEFDEAQWDLLLRRMDALEPLIRRQRALLDVYDPERRIELIVGEWGVWHDLPVTQPHVTGLRDAIAVAVGLEILHRNADVVKMAAFAQTVNVLAAPVVVDGAGRTLLTPIFDVFEMARVHRGRETAPLALPEGVQGTLTVGEGGPAVTLVNRSMSRPATVDLPFVPSSWTVLTHDDPRALNVFDAPDRVRSRPREVSGPRVELPPASYSALR